MTPEKEKSENLQADLTKFYVQVDNSNWILILSNQHN